MERWAHIGSLLAVGDVSERDGDEGGPPPHLPLLPPHYVPNDNYNSRFILVLVIQLDKYLLITYHQPRIMGSIREDNPTVERCKYFSYEQLEKNISNIII